MDIQKSKDIYTKLRAIPTNGLDESKIKAFFSESKANGKIKSEKNALGSFHLLHKVANQVDEKQWLNFVETNELPPLKLSAEDMELVRGGAVISIIGILGLGLSAMWFGYEVGKDTNQRP